MTTGFPYIALPIEVKKRELDAKCYLAYQFLRRGLPVILGSRPAVQHSIERRGGPFIYFHNCGTDSVEKLNSFVARFGGFMALLEDEGGVYPAGERAVESVLLRHSEELIDAASFCFSWGNWQRDCLVTHRSGLNDSNCFISGHPRFDLRKPEFLPCYQEDCDWKASPILVNTSFGVFNNQRSMAQMNACWKLAITPDLLQRYFDSQSEVLPRFVDAVKCLAKAQTDREIIVRPHPAEQPDYYHHAFAGIPNVKVDAVTSVQEVASRAVAVVHHDCTTAIEAAFFGHQPISIIEENFESDLTQILPVQISQRVVNGKQLCSAVEEQIAVRSKRPPTGLSEENARLIKPTIANTDFDSAELIADTVEKALPDLPMEQRPGIRGRRMVRRKLSNVAMLLTSWTPEARVIRNKMPLLQKSEVEHYIQTIGSVRGEPVSFRFSPSVGNSLFLEPKT